MNQNNSIILNWENAKNVVKIDHFRCFSDIMGVYYELNEHIDMNPIKSCQASSDTSLEYQQPVPERVNQTLDLLIWLLIC